MAASTPTPRKRTPRKAAPKTPEKPTVPLGEAPTTAAAWRAGVAAEDLRVPSGNVCKVRRVGMREWVREDIIPDSLMPLVQQAIARGQGINPAKLKADLTNPKKLEEMFELMDRVVALVVSQPNVIYHRYQRPEQPKPGETSEWIDIPMDDRDPNSLYTDEIDDADKMFIFNFAAGGVRDLERFRQQLGGSVGSVLGGENVGGEA